MSGFRPCLGVAVKSIFEIKLPCFASFKIDGWRATWFHREFFSRTFKAVPNRAVQEAFYQAAIRERTSIHGWDGELVYGEPNAPDVFRKTESLLSRQGGSADDVRWYVFDNAIAPGGFAERQDTLRDLFPRVIRLDQTLIESYEQLRDFEDYAVGLGYEGVVTRAPGGRYKNGRSTLKEQILVKIKRFQDDEAVVVGLEEMRHNANPATLDERGYTKRSSHAEGKVLAGVLGALVVDWKGQELRIGTGFTSADRDFFWRNPDKILGKSVSFRYLATGMKDLPRHPSFKGIRSDK